MPVPSTGIPPDLQLHLAEVEQRLSALENPQGFAPAFLTTSAALSAETASSFSHRWAFATDLGTVVWADGVHWYRADTGAVIV